jgi:malate dehydrogenase (oxaloacetate-decarboxylating)(NADP+)
MKPLFSKAKANPKRVIYAEGEDERVLRAVQVVVEEGIARPILIGRPNVVDTRIKRFGLSMEAGRHFDLINPEDDPRYRDYVATYVDVAGRKGITPDLAKTLVRTNTTVIGALAVRRGDADALICGLEGRFQSRLKHIGDIIGLAPGVREMAALSLVITSKGAYFLADTHVQPDPSAEQIAEMTVACASHVRRFGITPKIALLSHADFGAADTRSAIKMRAALALIRERAPDLEADGEMQADAALSEMIRERVYPGSTLKGEANVLIMPNLDAANIAFQFTKILADSLPVGPILIGPSKPAHILTPSVTARGIVNITAVAVVEAQAAEQDPTLF